ncbi:MAG: hypothetical protein P1Q69_21335, partial [Candidatus Thorarchaeota archaeon]|nr:hypothetical protein [Candidatus Thorarchaeota archaeon]
HKYLKTDTLSLALDSQDMKIQDIQPMIKNIGTKDYGIHDPRFSVNRREIDLMFASMLGAGLSDGHVEKHNRGFVYTESDPERVDIFQSQVQRFGDVYNSEDIRPNGVTRIRFSTSFGRSLENRGLTCGDKTYQNEGWPQWLKDAPVEAKLKYYKSMFQQDGSFTIDEKGRARFQVDRGVVMRDPGKSIIYSINDIASLEESEFVWQHGRRKQDERFGMTRQLNKGKLDDLENSPDEDISRIARSLKELVAANQPKLMVDERKGLEDCGIDSREYFAYLTYYENSERLSALWRYYTRTKDDAMRVGILCPPEDNLKRGKVENWMKTEPDRVKRVKNELGMEME